MGVFRHLLQMYLCYEVSNLFCFAFQIGKLNNDKKEKWGNQKVRKIYSCSNPPTVTQKSIYLIFWNNLIVLIHRTCSLPELTHFFHSNAVTSKEPESDRALASKKPPFNQASFSRNGYKRKKSTKNQGHNGHNLKDSKEIILGSH